MTIDPSLTFEQFSKKAKNADLVPISMRIMSDIATPIQLYSHLKERTYSYLLESVEGETKTARHSFVGCHPLVVLKAKGKSVSITDDLIGKNTTYRCERDPLAELQSVMKRIRVASHENPLFDGGFVGYVGYDAVKMFEPVLDNAGRSKDADVCFVLAQHVVVFDHLEKSATLISFAPARGKTKAALKKEYDAEIASMRSFIKNLGMFIGLTPLALGKKVTPIKPTSNTTKKKFESSVRAAQEHIKAGDIFQVVLSQRFETPMPASKAFDTYRYLRVINPSAYMYFLDFGDVKVAGASPEMLLRCEDGVLTTRPIAGTRKRGENEEQDIALEHDLLNDKKEVAEHVMLVDLGRNDIGRESEPSTVNVAKFKIIERFSHVMHISSEVNGVLKKGRAATDAFRACFPAGTLSGAPKIRAMQIIDELEPTPRGIYGGSIGYVSFNGNLDTAIAIRTVIFKGGKAYVQSGAGIVLDSVPESEYLETCSKAKAALTALAMAR